MGDHGVKLIGKMHRELPNIRLTEPVTLRCSADFSDEPTPPFPPEAFRFLPLFTGTQRAPRSGSSASPRAALLADEWSLLAGFVL